MKHADPCAAVSWPTESAPDELPGYEPPPFTAASSEWRTEATAPQTGVPFATDAAEKRRLIDSLLGRLTQPRHADLVRDALRVFAADNLRLAVDHGVRVNVLSLEDMPARCAGVNVQHAFRTLSLAGLTAIEPVSGERAAFIPAEDPTRGAVIHEMTHVLDTLKHAAPSSDDTSALGRAARWIEGLFGGDGSSSDAPGGLQWSSEQNPSLVAHYQTYANSARLWPDRIWSEYATTDVTEYMAEAVRVWAEQPQLLRSADPEMYEFARQFATDGGYPSAEFKAQGPS